MGCASSKIITRTGSFGEETRHSFQRIGRLEELLASKNDRGDQFLSLLFTANTVSRKLKSSGSLSPPREPESETDSKTIHAHEVEELTDIETINTWELLADLEEDHKDESTENQQQSDFVRARSIRTVEEFDAMVARDNDQMSLEEGKHAEGSDSSEGKEIVIFENTSEAAVSEKGSRRKTMSKELVALRVPAATFEFSKSGSLRDWLLRGGQIFSPGLYVTPKFGEFDERPEGHDGGDGEGDGLEFDPETVAQFEEAMQQLTLEEEGILKGILYGLGGGNE